LTGPEIRKDIREIQRTQTVESDSEGSVRSDEVLFSAYPVKPRKTPKHWMQTGANRGGGMDEGSSNQQDSMLTARSGGGGGGGGGPRDRNGGGSDRDGRSGMGHGGHDGGGGIQHHRYSHNGTPQFDTALAFETLKYIDGIKTAQRNIYDADLERGRLEELKEVSE